MPLAAPGWAPATPDATPGNPPDARLPPVGGPGFPGRHSVNPVSRRVFSVSRRVFSVSRPVAPRRPSVVGRRAVHAVRDPPVPLVCTTLLRQDRLHSGASGEFPASTPRPFHSFAPLCSAKTGCTRERQVSFLRQLPARSTRLHYLCTLKICPWIPPHRSTA